MIKKLGVVTRPREPAFRVLVHFSGRLRLCTCLTYLSRSVGTRGPKGGLEDVSTRSHTARRAVVQRQPLEDLLLLSIFVMDVLKKLWVL